MAPDAGLRMRSATSLDAEHRLAVFATGRFSEPAAVLTSDSD